MGRIPEFVENINMGAALSRFSIPIVNKQSASLTIDSLHKSGKVFSDFMKTNKQNKKNKKQAACDIYRSSLTSMLVCVAVVYLLLWFTE